MASFAFGGQAAFTFAALERQTLMPRQASPIEGKCQSPFIGRDGSHRQF
jgi:hypothetical protein